MAPAAQASPYRIGIMTMDVEGKDSDAFHRMVKGAVERLRQVLGREERLDLDVVNFEGPHLLPSAGGYAPLDFFEIGFAEKAERDIPFLLMVTEVDLSGPGANYTLALPSQLTNMAVISTKRLDPEFWGETRDNGTTEHRLAALMLHCFGALVNLKPSSDPRNFMYLYGSVDDLDAMERWDEAQWDRVSGTLPAEAQERRTETGRAGFVASVLVSDIPQIARAVARANPFRLVPKLPTLIAAALSVIIVLLFGAETWDVAHEVTMAQVGLFSAVSLLAALYLLYRAFTLDAMLGRDRVLTETSVVTAAATFLALLLTLLILYAAFALLMYGAIATVFPESLMDAWVSDGAATQPADHLRLSLFLAAMGVLAGSLGGRSDSRNLVRGVLFTGHAH
ncbi:hypothetical protein [Qipengyuania nanhaisediminis]|uniref:hypothetical protein n=1 Tax=Qipengyuania nanhaisediminis TaxID=604088 RepID=UPI0038B2BE22